MRGPVPWDAGPIRSCGRTSLGSCVASALRPGPPRRWQPSRYRCHAPPCSPSPRSVGRPSTHSGAPSEARSGRARPASAVDERVLVGRVSTVTAMGMLTKQFQSRVAASVDRTGMRTSTPGRHAVGDPNLVRQLRPGRSPRLAMAYQVPVFIEACRRAHVAPVPSRGNAPRNSSPNRTEADR